MAGAQNGKLCRFWALVGCALKKRRKPSGQRCAYARRWPEGVAAPLGCVILFSPLSKLRFSHSVLRAFRVCETWEVSLPSVRFACSRNAGRPLAKTANLPFSCVPYLHLRKTLQDRKRPPTFSVDDLTHGMVFSDFAAEVVCASRRFPLQSALG